MMTKKAPDASWVMVFNTDALPGHDAGAVSTGGPTKAKAVCEEKGFGGGEGGGKQQKSPQKLVDSSDFIGQMMQIAGWTAKSSN